MTRIIALTIIATLLMATTAATATNGSTVPSDIKQQIKHEQPTLTDKGVETVYGSTGTSEQRKELNKARLNQNYPIGDLVKQGLLKMEYW